MAKMLDIGKQLTAFYALANLSQSKILIYTALLSECHRAGSEKFTVDLSTLCELTGRLNKSVIHSNRKKLSMDNLIIYHGGNEYEIVPLEVVERVVEPVAGLVNGRVVEPLGDSGVKCSNSAGLDEAEKVVERVVEPVVGLVNGRVVEPLDRAQEDNQRLMDLIKDAKNIWS